MKVIKQEKSPDCTRPKKRGNDFRLHQEIIAAFLQFLGRGLFRVNVSRGFLLDNLD